MAACACTCAMRIDRACDGSCCCCRHAHNRQQTHVHACEHMHKERERGGGRAPPPSHAHAHLAPPSSSPPVCFKHRAICAATRFSAEAKVSRRGDVASQRVSVDCLFSRDSLYVWKCKLLAAQSHTSSLLGFHSLCISADRATQSPLERGAPNYIYRILCMEPMVHLIGALETSRSCRHLRLTSSNDVCLSDSDVLCVVS